MCRNAIHRKIVRLDCNRSQKLRTGALLLIVVVVIAAFSVAVYAFSHKMVAELAITNSKRELEQQRRLAESAILKIYHSDKKSLEQLARPNESHEPMGRTKEGRFAILKNIPRPGTPAEFGLLNESSKLNLNSLRPRNLSRKQVIARLTRYPNLNESTAAGIADLLGILDMGKEENAAPKEMGRTMPPATLLTTWEPLLKVAGINEERLYGEDRNGNGVLDPCENDGDLSFPPDNADGRLDAGWSGEWTLIGAESNHRSDGRLKVHLNQSDLVALYDQLIEFATPEEARFVVAWRKSSAIYTDTFSSNERLTEEELYDERVQTFRDRIKDQLGIGSNDSAKNEPMQMPSIEGGGNSERDRLAKVRAGIDLSVSSGRKLKSLLDLANCQVQILIDGKDTILVSPFAGDPVSLSRWLSRWESVATIEEGPITLGRINILQASRRTLETVDGISPQLAQSIVSARESWTRNVPGQVSDLTVGWLLEAGLVTSSELRKIADEITVGGSVFRGYGMGQLKDGRTASAIFVELDGRGPAMKLRRSVDLPLLNRMSRLSDTD